MAQRRRTFATRTARRKRVWARSSITVAGVTLAAPAITDLTSQWAAAAGVAVPIGTTVSRIRGQVSALRTAGTSVQPQVGVGVQVASANIEAVDMMPSDFVPASAGAFQDWMYWELRQPPDVPTAPMYFAWEVDNKAMRKMEEVGERLWFAMSIPNADTWSFVIGLSVLLLLP